MPRRSDPEILAAEGEERAVGDGPRAAEVFGLAPEMVDSVMRGQTDPARGAASVDA